MRDPMAGNGKQTWQRWSWSSGAPSKRDQIHEGEQGNGLMETLAVHPRGGEFVMAGRLAQGKWNVALFDAATGALTQSLDTKSRVTRAVWSRDGDRLFLAGALAQDKRKDKEAAKPAAEHGRVHVYRYAQTRG
jgi:hypothetical protein